MTDQSFEPDHDSGVKGRGLKQAGRLAGAFVGVLALSVGVLIVALVLFAKWQTQPRSSVGIDSPEIARPKFQAIEDRLSSELTGDNGNVVNNRFLNRGKPNPEEISQCDGRDGTQYNVRRKLDGPATQDDYETAVEVLESLPGWSSSSIDADSVEGLTQVMFTHEETGAIVVSLQEKASPPELAFWMMSGCYRE